MTLNTCSIAVNNPTLRIFLWSISSFIIGYFLGFLSKIYKRKEKLEVKHDEHST